MSDLFQLCKKAFKAKRSLQYHQFMLHGLEHKNSTVSARFAEARKRKMKSTSNGLSIHSNNNNNNNNYFEMIRSNMNMFVYPLLASPRYGDTASGTTQSLQSPTPHCNQQTDEVSEDKATVAEEELGDSKNSSDTNNNEATEQASEQQQHNAVSETKAAEVTVGFRRPCHICGRVFSRPSTLGWHLRMHSAHIPFRCKVTPHLFSLNTEESVASILVSVAQTLQCLWHKHYGVCGMNTTVCLAHTPWCLWHIHYGVFGIH